MSALTILLLVVLSLVGCADVTRPTPTSHEVEAVQLTALTRQPHANYSAERAMRVFLRLLPTLPRIHGRTYPFLGFNWWVTEAGHPVVDNVWYPSPAHDRPLKSQVVNLHDPREDRTPGPDAEPSLKRGDLILAVNGMPIPTWVKDWDYFCQSLRNLFKYSLPGEALVNFVLTARYARQEAQGAYRGGAVTLLIDRQGVRKQVTLYPVHLPAEYGLMVVTGSAGASCNTYAAPGRILISHRLLNLCRSDDELAIVLGHELAHHAHGHLVRKTVQYPLSGLFAEIIAAPFLLLAPGAVKDTRRDVQGAMISVYSRGDELEADAYGLWYAYQAGYDVDQGIYLWERVAAVVDRNVLESTYFLDSHPAAPERLARLKKIAQLYKEGKAAQVLVE
jgi:Zn-dependent protease with chaperone function